MTTAVPCDIYASVSVPALGTWLRVTPLPRSLSLRSPAHTHTAGLAAICLLSSDQSVILSSRCKCWNLGSVGCFLFFFLNQGSWLIRARPGSEIENKAIFTGNQKSQPSSLSIFNAGVIAARILALPPVLIFVCTHLCFRGMLYFPEQH